MFWIAFAIGAGVLWLFAQDQFNHPSWNNDPSRRTDDRLARILSVPDLRGDRVRKRALLVYFLLLLLVYAVFVFFGGTIVAALDAGIASPQNVAGGAAPRPLELPGPSVPFAVSLAMVGIAPRLELLTKIEEKIRIAAHEMMGLPRGLLSSGETLADTELQLDDIGTHNIDPVDLERFRGHVRAASAMFGKDAVKVKLFEKRLVKLIAYKVWVVDGIWPATKVREPYEILESDFATDMSACLADLDDIASVSQEAMSATERDTLRKRWDDRITATKELCGEICALLFIYFEKQDPSVGANGDPIHTSISNFFRRATGGKTTAPELDIAIKSIVGAVGIAAVCGYVGVMLRQWSGLPQGNPGVGALTAAIGALFLYGPTIAIAIGTNARLSGPGTPGPRLTASRRLATAVACYLVSLLFLVLLNIAQAIVIANVPLGSFRTVAYAALLSESPVALLGALQGFFVLAYLQAYSDPERTDPTCRWRLIMSNVASMVLLSVVVTHLVVAAVDTVGKWSNPAFVRVPHVSDFASRVPRRA